MKKIVTLTALGLILATANANAAGFHLREQSGAGLGNAFAGATAGAEDISYAYFNVAGLTRHKGTQMNLGATYIAPEARARKIDGDNGSEENVDNIVHAAVAPNMAFSHQLNDEVTLGLGVNVPFGMVTKYDDRNWAGADHGITSKVTTVTTTPMVAWKATDKLSIGAGLPIQYFKAKLSQRTMLSTDGSYTKLEGDTVDVGYQIGAMYEFNENTRIGINYRSEINHKLKGDIENKTAATLGVGFLNQDINARIDTPAMLSVGAFHKINDKWEVMAEYQKVFWNSFDSIDIYGREKGGNPLLASGNLISSTPEHWEDTDFYAIGASYNVDDKWKLRFGLAYDDSAVRKDYRTPRIPDSRRVWYSTGASYKYSDNLTFNAAYTFIKAEKAEINLKGVSADYKNQVHIFGLSMNYSF
ncbi:MAG: hypothetical protein E7017_00340 [Alphaproteobacteria bacterium]|nr:hypothetical protein [Alphaproteobacteria bacterium]